MRRDAAETRDRLLAAAEQLFAIRGVYRTTLREITQAAGQRNTSAVSYHFGSRTGLLEELLLRHAGPLDEQRGVILAGLDPDPDTRALVGVLLRPLLGCLDDPSGRNYLRIVAQLSDQFAQWRDEAPYTGPNLRTVLDDLERRPVECAPAARRERLIALMMLLTSVMAERARQIDDDASLPIDGPGFEANLHDVLVGIVEAPASMPSVA